MIARVFRRLESQNNCAIRKRQNLFLRARLHGKRVPLGDKDTLPARVEDTVVPHASSNKVGTPSLAGSRDSVILHELNCPYLGLN